MRSEWREVTLAEIMEIMGGGTPNTKVAEYWNGDIPWISVKDFNNNQRYVYHTQRSITHLGLQNSSTKLLEKGDLIISARGTVGQVAQLGKPMAFNQTSYGLRAKPEMTTNDFLYYLLLNMNAIIKGNTHGTVFDTITRETFNVLRAALPPLPTQKAIADTLSCLDAKIEVNNKINENLEKQTQAIFKSWFVDFEPFQDGEFVESELRNLPRDWRIGHLGDLMEITSGKRPGIREELPTSGIEVPVVGASKIMGYTNEVLFDDKIIVIGRVGTHGVIQRFDYPCWPSDNTLVIKPHFYEFVYQSLKLVNFSALNRGSTQPLITQSDLKNLEIVIPPHRVLEDYEELASILMSPARVNEEQNTTLATLRDTLLPKLMSGEIEVPIGQ